MKGYFQKKGTAEQELLFQGDIDFVLESIVKHCLRYFATFNSYTWQKTKNEDSAICWEANMPFGIYRIYTENEQEAAEMN